MYTKYILYYQNIMDSISIVMIIAYFIISKGPPETYVLLCAEPRVDAASGMMKGLVSATGMT